MTEASTLQWEIDQLVKARLFPDEQAVLRSALRALYESHPELRRRMVAGAYIAGELRASLWPGTYRRSVSMRRLL